MDPKKQEHQTFYPQSTQFNQVQVSHPDHAIDNLANS